MDKQHVTNVKWVTFTVWIIILTGLYLTSLYSFLLYHSLVEIFSIVLACGIFMVAWNARRFMDNNYLLFLGIAYLFIGGLDLIHTLAYKGMGIFPGYDANLPTQLWILARYMESLSLLLAPFVIDRRLKTPIVFSAYAAATTLALCAIFYWRIFPDCFIEGFGLTGFKKASEYIISLILISSIVLLFNRRKVFDKQIVRLLIVSIILKIGSELSFTFYISVYGASNIIGHFLKLISFYFIYKSIIESGLMAPYSLLFKKLKQHQDVLQELNIDLEKRVTQWASELQQEVAERKYAQVELIKSKNMLQSVFDNISEPLFLLGRDLTLKMCNKAAMAYYNITGQDVTGKPCYEAFYGRSRSCDDCVIPDSVLEGQHVSFERKGRMDKNRLEKVVIYPVIEVHNEIESVIIRISDITESRRLEKKLVQSEKMASLGILISGIAHEINNPNNYISVNLPILREYLNIMIPIIDGYARNHPDFEILNMSYREFREDIYELIDNVQHGSRQIKSIVKDLKGFASPDRDRTIENIDLEPVIDKVVAFCRSRIRRTVKTFKVTIQPDLQEVLVSPHSLEQILINLLINAAQAFEKPVNINSQVELIVFSAGSDRNRIIIEVRDNGCGMAQETIDRYFI